MLLFHFKDFTKIVEIGWVAKVCSKFLCVLPLYLVQELYKKNKVKLSKIMVLAHNFVNMLSYAQRKNLV